MKTINNKTNREWLSTPLRVLIRDMPSCSAMMRGWERVWRWGRRADKMPSTNNKCYDVRLLLAVYYSAIIISPHNFILFYFHIKNVKQKHDFNISRYYSLLIPTHSHTISLNKLLIWISLYIISILYISASGGMLSKGNFAAEKRKKHIYGSS